MPMTDLTIRPVLPSDLPTLLALNNSAVPAVNELTLPELKELVDTCLICFVADLGGKPSGFLLCIAEGSSYDSRNYVWLSERLDKFAYTDRICVDPALRGQRTGERLYQALFQHCAGDGRVFTCEVNERPPNPGSLKFHQRLGFEIIGRQDHGEKAVVYLRRPAGTEPGEQDSLA